MKKIPKFKLNSNRQKHSSHAFFMRSLMLLLFVFFVGALSANNYAQNTRLNISVEKVSLKKALKVIEKQSEFYFMYNDTQINASQKVSIRAENQTIFEVLDQMLADKNIDYEVMGKQVILSKKKTHKATQIKQPNDTITISGQVYDETGGGFPGVNVTIKGTTQGTMTDLNGNFKLNLQEPNQTLVFSYIGYETVEINTAGRKNIEISMKPDLTNIEEVVVVGYGTQSKKLITGSVSDVSGDEISESVSTGIEGALQGKAAGVQVVQNSGTPGAASSIKIRGTGSIFSGTQPLYVIDGVPMTTGNYGQISFEGQGIDAGMDINPADIESVTILKDAAATIYGARAANGVVLITTKSGSAGKTTVNYSGYTGIQEEWKRLDLLNAEEWKEYANTFDPNFVESLDPNIDTDWQEEVFRRAPINNHKISVSGGNKKTKVYVSGGYFDQVGIVLGSDYKKYSGRINLDHAVTDKFNIKTNFGSSYIINNRIVGDQTINGVLPNAISKPPVYAVKDELGNYLEEGFWDNPVAIGNEVTNEARTIRNISNIELNYDISDNLEFSNQTGFDFYNLNERRYEPTTVKRGAASNGIAIDARSNVQKIIQQSTLRYKLNINTNNRIRILAGYSLESIRDRYNFIRGIDFPSDNLEFLNSAGTIENAYSGGYNERINSLFGRVNYNLKDKYLLEISIRRDGSSNFGENNKYATFPAASLAWRIIEENFMQNSIFSDLKLKASFGLSGNDQIGSHRYQNLYSSGNNYYNQPGLIPRQIPNPDLRWERSENYNVGLNLAVFDNRISFAAEFYLNNTSDLLLPRPIPGNSGFTSYTTNIGELKNQGMEYSINTVNFDGNFSWSSNFNISFNKNEITALYNNQPILGEGRGNNAVIVGEPVGVFYMHESLGVDPTTGELVFRDVNEDGQITDEDRKVVGNPNPIFTGGFINNLAYAGFELRFFFQFSYGNDIFNGTRQYAEAMTFGTSDNQLATIQDRWQEPGDVTYIPRYNGKNNLFPISSHYLEDGSYLRLKDISLAYNFSNKALERIGFISKLRIYVKSQNLLTFTAYSGLDPEVNYSGVGTIRQGTDFFTYPQARTYIFGVNIDF
jgi:TonB-linked SusC/RagA family outer membrane protein